MQTIKSFANCPDIYIFIQKMNFLEIAMLFLNQVIGFFKIIDDDDIDNIIIGYVSKKKQFFKWISWAWETGIRNDRIQQGTVAELLGVKWVRSGKPIWNPFYDVWNRYP